MSLNIPPFLEFTESKVGFWVDRWWNDYQQLWEHENGPIRWSEKQRPVLAYLFNLEGGRFRYNTIYWIDIGKSAKTLLAAAVADWLARHVPGSNELIFAANSREQADARAFQALKDSLDRNPYLGEFAEIVGKDKDSSVLVKYHSGQARNKVVPIATKAKSQAGKNQIYKNADEFHGWIGDGARSLHAELKPSPTQNISLSLFTTYPGYVDDDSPLNDTLDEAFDNEGNPREGWEKIPELADYPVWVRGNVAIYWNHDPYPWHEAVQPSGMTFLEEQENDPANSKTEFMRIWKAIRTQRVEVFLPIELWDRCEDEHWPGIVPNDRDVPLCLGVDMGKGDPSKNYLASSALIGRGFDIDTRRYPLMLHHIWSPQLIAALGIDDIFAVVEQRILDIHRRHKLFACYYDPWQMYSTAARLRKLGVNMVELTQNTGRTLADTDYRRHIIQGTLRNYEKAVDLRRHVKNAVGREVGNNAIRLDKRLTTQDIDGAVADSQACMAVTDHIEQFEKWEQTRWERENPAEPRRRVNWSDIYRLGAGYE